MAGRKTMMFWIIKNAEYKMMNAEYKGGSLPLASSANAFSATPSPKGLRPLKSPFLILFFFFSLSLYALPSAKEIRNLKVKPRSEIFFTQMENCYALEIEGISPSQVMLELPELPLGTRFISSKKEEFISQSGQRGTLISLWFTFSDSGESRLSPLLVKINGKNHYIEFEPIFVYENPNLISPSLEISFENQKIRSEKDGRKILTVSQGEKIVFTLDLRYGTQILDFKWNIPKDSIFSERERFEFANGNQKITQFTTEKQNIARFEWQILKEGEYALPEITVAALSYNGSKKILSLPGSIRVIVKGKSHRHNESQKEGAGIFENAFEKPSEEVSAEKKSAPTREECEARADKSRLTFFDKLFSRRFAIFTGGLVSSVPEEKMSANHFEGGVKVKITESAGEWAFIECDEFSGWTKNENIIERK